MIEWLQDFLFQSPFDKSRNVDEIAIFRVTIPLSYFGAILLGRLSENKIESFIYSSEWLFLTQERLFFFFFFFYVPIYNIQFKRGKIPTHRAIDFFFLKQFLFIYLKSFPNAESGAFTSRHQFSLQNRHSQDKMLTISNNQNGLWWK